MIDINVPNVTPVDAEGYCARGVARLESGQWQDAIDDFTQAITLRPDIAAGYRFRARAHAESGNVVRAIADLDHALRLYPDDIRALFDRGQFLFKQKQYDEALNDCNRALALDAARADLLALRGRVQEARGESQAAHLDFTKAIEIDPEGAPDYYVWRADLLIENERYELALSDLNRAIELFNENAYAYSRRASAHWAMGNLDLAIDDYSLAIQYDPQWVWVRNGRGLVHHEKAEYEAALADFDAALKIDANHGSTHECRVETLWKLGRKAEALEAIDKAIKLSPECLRLFNRRAMIHYFCKRYMLALRDHTSALKCDPNNAETFNYLGWIWATAPDPTVRNGRRALECATRACELSEFQTGSYLDTLAAAHAELGNYAEAEKWASKAAECAHDDVSREEFASRIDLYRGKQPLRVTPQEP